MEPDAQLGILPGTTFQVDPSSAWPIAGDTGIAQGQGTGQYGVTPIVGPGGGAIGDGFVKVWHYINRPFTTPMSPATVFMLVGVIIVAVVVWNLVLYHIRIAGEAI